MAWRSTDVAEAFLQRSFPGEPPILELFFDGHEFCLRGLTLAEFCTVFARELRGVRLAWAESDVAVPPEAADGRWLVENAPAIPAASGRIAWSGGPFDYESDRDHFTRVFFRELRHLRRAVAAVLRGFVLRLTAAPHVAPVDARTLDRFIAAVDGRGVYASAQNDVLVTDRTVEIAAVRGRTAWSPDEDTDEEARLFLYYDRTSGIWAVA